MPQPLQPDKLLATLVDHNVDFVLIGGLAAALHGSPAITNDADICPRRDLGNLEHLAKALRSMKPRVRTSAEPDGLAFACDASFLSRLEMVNLTTEYGDFDISYSPAGTNGYEDLASRAVTFEIDGIRVKVAALDDIIRSKETANRPKDHATLPLLYALRDQIEDES